MAHVLNKPERNQAFWKFLFLFLLCTALIVSTVYFFNVRSIPTKVNDVLQEQVSHYRIQDDAEEKFIKSMEDASELIESLDKPNTNTERTNLKVNDKIQDLQNLYNKDSSIYGRLNTRIITVLINYHSATNKSVNIGDLPKRYDDIKAKYDQCDKELIDARLQIHNLQNESSPQN